MLKAFSTLYSPNQSGCPNSSNTNDSEESTWIERFFGDFRLSNSDPNLQRFVDHVEVRFKKIRGSNYIFCLSEKQDLLSQWRGYGDDGKGVCFAFHPSSIGLKQRNPLQGPLDNDKIGILPVEYNQQRQYSLFQLAIHNGYDFFKKSNYDFDNLKNFSDFTSDLISQYSSVFKNPHFSEETEWRIIHRPSKIISNSNNGLSDIKFRISNNTITNYFQYNLSDLFDSSLISKVVIGPKSNLQIPMVLEFLKVNNLKHTDVFVSDLSYR